VSKIHPTSIINEKAQIADSAEIGPFCTIGPNVKIGAGTRLMSHCNVSGYTTIGENNTFFPFVSVGTDPQDHGYFGKESFLKIGNDNFFREGFTANVGTKEGSITSIGDHCYFMTNTHVAHNCQIGNKVIAANCTGFSGYSEIGDSCVFSGLCGTHQFVKVGRFVMMSGGSVTSVNIPPFVIADGRNGAIKAMNIVGLRRNGFTPETISTLKDLFKIFFVSGLNVTNALAKIDAEIEPLPEVKEFIDFIKTSKRAVATGRGGRRV
jgi:UDP-N-acetylglucosamine acyltransferase